MGLTETLGTWGVGWIVELGWVSSVLKMSAIKLSKDESWAPHEKMQAYITKLYNSIIFLKERSTEKSVSRFYFANLGQKKGEAR